METMCGRCGNGLHTRDHGLGMPLEYLWERKWLAVCGPLSYYGSGALKSTRLAAPRAAKLRGVGRVRGAGGMGKGARRRLGWESQRAAWG